MANLDGIWAESSFSKANLSRIEFLSKSPGEVRGENDPALAESLG